MDFAKILAKLGREVKSVFLQNCNIEHCIKYMSYQTHNYDNNLFLIRKVFYTAFYKSI